MKRYLESTCAGRSHGLHAIGTRQDLFETVADA